MASIHCIHLLNNATRCQYYVRCVSCMLCPNNPIFSQPHPRQKQNKSGKINKNYNFALIESVHSSRAIKCQNISAKNCFECYYKWSDELVYISIVYLHRAQTKRIIDSTHDELIAFEVLDFRLLFRLSCNLWGVGTVEISNLYILTFLQRQCSFEQIPRPSDTPQLFGHACILQSFAIQSPLHTH